VSGAGAISARPVLAVIAAASLFGTAGAAASLLVPSAWPPSVAAVRLAVGATGLLVVATVWKGHGRDLRRLITTPAMWLMGAAVAGYQVAFFLAVDQASVAVAALVTIGSAPLFAGVLSWALGDGPPGWIWAGMTAMGISGLALLTGVIGSYAASSSYGLGVLAALIAGFSYAVYTVVGARVTRAGSDGIVVLAAAFCAAAVLVSPALLLAGQWLWSLQGLTVALWTGLGATTLAYVFFAAALPVLRPATIATLTLAEPLTATFLAVVLLGEMLSAGQWWGIALLGMALVGIGVTTSRRPDTQQEPHSSAMTPTA
jgi:drug/metabolite transporter, DME family